MNAYLSGVSAVLAGIISFCFLYSAHRRLPLRAALPISARIIVDAMSAFMALPLIATAYPNFTLIHEPLVQISLATMVGPGFLRLQLTSGNKRESKLQDISPAYVFNKLTKIVDNSIDRASAITQSEWLEQRVAPALENLTVSELGEKAKAYISNLTLLDQKSKQKQIDFIAGIVEQADSSDNAIAKLTMVQRLIDSDGHNFVRNLVRRQEENNRLLVAGK